LIAQIAEENGRSSATLEILPRLLFYDFAIERILRRLWHEAASESGGSRSYVEAQALSLAVHLIRHYAAGKPRGERSCCGMAPFRLKRVLDFIETHYTEDISLSDMAKVAEMSLCHFARSFHGATGCSPHRYLIERRLQQACVLLNDSDIPIASIAYRIGLHNQSHFSQLFARHLGTTPRRFRLMQSQ
jgi:AraC family transcriptional regulator